MYDFVKALKSLYPGTFWSLDGDSYEGFTWSDDNVLPKPTEEELIAECIRLKSIYDNNEYQRQRAKEYPSFANQFDLLYHGGYDAWKDSIQAVKDKYPKPE